MVRNRFSSGLVKKQSIVRYCPRLTPSEIIEYSKNLPFIWCPSLRTCVSRKTSNFMADFMQFRVKTFWGESENAVRIQIHVAIITYCLIGIIERRLNLNRPIVQIMRILSSALLLKEDIAELFFHSEEEEEPSDGQLEIDFHFD